MPLLCQILECASALNQNPATTPLSIKISTTTIRYNTTSAHTLQILDAPLVLSNTSEHIQVVQTPNAEQIKHDTWENKSRLYSCFTTNKGHMFDRKFAEHGVPERVCSAQGQCCGFLEHQTWFHSKKKRDSICYSNQRRRVLIIIIILYLTCARTHPPYCST